MASGFLSGLVAGAAVSGFALGTLSVVAGGGQDAAPGAATIEVPAGSEFNQSLVDGPAQMPDADGAPAIASDAPKVDTAAPDDLSAMGAENTQPSQRPETGGIDADLSAPQVPSDGSGIIASLPDEAADAGAEESVVPETTAETAPDVTSDIATAPAPGAEDPAISADPAQPSMPEVEASAGLTPSDAGSQDAPEMDNDPLQDAPDSSPEPSIDAPDASDEDAMPSGTIGDIAEDIETNRLPSVGPEPVELEIEEVPEDPRAIARNAAPFDNPEGKPLMAIVLIDNGSSPIGLEALDAFPYPLSFAVDAMRPDAAEAMARYRDAGFEVLAMADLPESADARDAEAVMQTVFAAVPEAVGVLEGSGTGLQISRDASEQLVPILLESGHGLVLFAKGLQTAPKLIAREGVPVGTIFRDFDSNDQSATVIRRFLDQAAFKAGRDEEGVIMLGRLRADTISALLLWGLQDRASRVALAPISAVLLAED
ncbi:divergent polysaccharide deacetylase family protein [Roseovarius sp. S4756]|uniref:divergent polysaccharide deacteylase family protein n=1 Tax=Roseovarius maritimus TaxID=3342637 RepID=UPI00372899B8